VLTCPSCNQENPEGFKFCGACGSPLAAPEPAPEEERKVVTALFTDIVGSTASAEQLDPEDVRARLAPYYARLRKELEAYGGTVEKFIGDAVVALFGAPVAHEDDPERAVRAALAINDAVAELNAEDEWLDIHIRTAVHTGEALVVVGAKAVEGEGMAAGDVMNTAARLQGGAPVDGIAVGEATYRATSHAFEYREAEPVQAKGKAEPIPIWEVLGEKEAPERPAARTTLVGRAAELGRLTAAWEKVLSESRPRLMTVLGPPGIGKSRLLLALCEHVQEAATVHWGRCLSYGEGMTYWPITEIIKSAAGIRHDDAPETDSAKLGNLLRSLPTEDEDELRTLAAALANLVGVSTTPRGTYSVESISQAELHWAIRRLFPLLARERPMLLVFEDLHWAEPTLIELLQSLTDPKAKAPFLILGSARPELAESQPAFVANVDGRESFSLMPLGEDEIEQLLTELLADTPLDSAHVQRLVRNAGGNPLFLEETVRMVAEAKDEQDLENLAVPDTVQALIGSRLDNLPQSDKRVAQQASVVGNVFWPGAVAHIGAYDGDLQPSLDTLERRDFVHSRRETAVVGEQEYEFKHILIRDVAYERLPKGRRAELHARFIDWLGALGSDDEFVEIEAYHLEQACVLAGAVARAPIEPPVLEAIDALKRSAEKAERREGLREADRFYARGLELLNGQYPEASLELRLRRGATLVQLGHLAEAERLLLAVAAEAEERDRLDLRCAALVELGDVDQRQGRAAEARAKLVEAGELARRAGDKMLEIRAVFVLAALKADFDGAYGDAIDDLRGAGALADELDNTTLRAEGNLRLAAMLMNLGRLEEAEHELERCLALAGALGSRKFEAEAISWLGTVRFYRGQAEEGARLWLQARNWLELTCDSYFQVQNLVRGLAIYELARGDAKAAERWLQEALPIALEIGGWVVVETYRFLTEALLRQGRLEDARELVAFAKRNLPEEDRWARADVLIAGAAVASFAGEAPTAVAGYEEAIRLLAELNMPFEIAETRLAFARALRRLGDGERARAELERARDLFAEMQANGVLAGIDRELAEIEEGAGPAGPLVRA
jgi:class 3 adenylate cyclase/tetratricopeptide (TPR) repeat protein